MKKKAKKEIKKEKNNNIFFILGFIIIVIILIVLSILPKSEEEDKLFDINNYEYISSIGIEELKVSLLSDERSIIMICSSEEKDCRKMIKDINSICKEKGKGIEYIDNVLLVDSEKDYLKTVHTNMNKSEFPHILMIENKKIINIKSKYLSKEEIEDFINK